MVAKRVLAAGLEARVVIATDDPRVVAAVAPLGVEGILTDPAHRSGTERVAEVARLPRFRHVDVVLNVQGDEPLLPPDAMHGAVGRVALGDPIGTAAAPLSTDALGDPHQVKVVVDGAGRALRFSRAFPASGAWHGDVEVLRHMGVYAYTPDALQRWVALPPVAEERAEALEQLRPLAHGIPIGVARLAEVVTPGIDTEADLTRVEAHLG